MIFGMIGAGTLSQAIASHPLKAGHEVIFSNSRGPATLTELVARLGRGASAGTVAQAGEADFVVLATTWSRVRNALDMLPPRPGRILIDATNQWADPPPAAVLDVLDVGGSELVASLRPEAHVIKAFDNLYGPSSRPIRPPRWAAGSSSTPGTRRTQSAGSGRWSRTSATPRWTSER